MNTAAIPVRSYSLIGGITVNGRGTSRSFGVLDVCDRCINENRRGAELRLSAAASLRDAARPASD